MIACEFLDSLTTKDTLTVFSGLLTPLLAIIATYIAWQQWRTNHIKLQHDLYDRRLVVYLALMEFLAHISRNASADINSGISFIQKTKESYFLFGKEIPEYLESIYKKSVQLDYLHKKLHESNLPVGEERSRAAQESCDLSIWFGDQFEIGRKKFEKYLKLY